MALADPYISYLCYALYIAANGFLGTVSRYASGVGLLLPYNLWVDVMAVYFTKCSLVTPGETVTAFEGVQKSPPRFHSV